MAKRDYYEVLEVPREETYENIVKAFRRLAKKFHTDTNKDSEANARFVELNEAYQVLSNSQTRGAYDTGGFAAVEELEEQLRNPYTEEQQAAVAAARAQLDGNTGERERERELSGKQKRTEQQESRKLLEEEHDSEKEQLRKEDHHNSKRTMAMVESGYWKA